MKAGRGGGRLRETGVGDTEGCQDGGGLSQAVRLGDWDHTHSNAREASLSWEAPQTSRSILPRGPWGTRVTLK